MAIPNPTQLAVQKRTKLGIPAPNPDPQPPNAPSAQPQGITGQAQAANPAAQAAANKFNPTPFKAPTQSSPSPAPAPTTAPTAYAPGQDPRDSTYWNQMAQLTMNKGFGLRELDINSTYNTSEYEAQMGQLQRQQPREELAYKENQNRGGAFYSSKTTEGLGQIAQNYFDQASSLTRGFNRETALKDLARDVINSGYTLDQASTFIEAVDRASQAEIDRPAPSYQNPVQAAVQQHQGGNGDRPAKPGPNFKWDDKKKKWIKS